MRRVYLSTLLSGFLTPLCAGTMGPVAPDWHWLMSLSGGPTWESAGKSQSIYLLPTVEKRYVAHKKTTTLGTGEVLLGMQKNLAPYVHQPLIAQVGIDYAYSGVAKLKGVIWDDADPRFADYAYHYKIEHQHVGLKGKLLADLGYWAMPWFSAGVNVGFNHAYGFKSRPLIEEAVPTPNFKSHSQTAFTYTLGAGLQKQWNEHVQVGIGYEFADWGKNHLGRTPTQTLNKGIQLNHLYTNGLLFNITYLA